MRISDWSSDVCSFDLIPFGAGCLKYGLRIDIEFVENKCKLVDQGDVDIALSVFNDFRGFGDAYGRRLVRAGHNDLAIQLVDQLGDLRRRRTEARRGGKECVSTGRARGAP